MINREKFPDRVKSLARSSIFAPIGTHKIALFLGAGKPNETLHFSGQNQNLRKKVINFTKKKKKFTD